MPRSREDIEAEIAALQAELRATQPSSVKISSIYDSLRTFSFRRGGGGDMLSIDVTTRDAARVPNTLASKADACALRDFLNYHFPKTEENA